MAYKTLIVSPEVHNKIKLIASLEAQTMNEWVEWVVNKAYESAMANRGRKNLPIVKQ